MRRPITPMAPCVVLIAGWLLSGGVARAQSCAELRDLGTLGGNESFATAISADGLVVVGSAQDVGGRSRAFRWTESGGLQDLGVPGLDSIAQGVSADGAVVVGSYTPTAGSSRAFRWTASSGAQDLPLPGSTGSYAGAVSENGAAIAGASWTSPFIGREVFRWQAATGAELLCFSTAAFQCEATDLSADGSVVVGWTGGAWGSAAWRWTAPGGLQVVVNNARANDVSADGQWIVGSYLAGLLQPPARPYLWTAGGGLVDLGDLGGPEGEATGVAAGGVAVVGRTELSGGQARAFRWTPADGLRDLGTLGGATARATDVSRDGTIVVGAALDATGRERAFRVQVSAVGQSYCRPAAANSAGCGGFLDVTGDSHLAVNALRLTARLLPPNAAGFFLLARDRDRVPLAGGSQGTLCLGGAIGRFVGPGQVQSSGAAGSFTLALDLGALPSPGGPLAAQPGETWHFQAWHRDLNPTPTSNFTDAVAVTLR